MYESPLSHYSLYLQIWVHSRLLAERYIVESLPQDQRLQIERERSNTTRALTEKFKSSFPQANKEIAVFEKVNLMTPENIHINSFMYEPIIDMSDEHLRELFKEVKEMNLQNLQAAFE